MKLLRRLSYAALAFGFLHIVFGAIVRISGSGLGCGDHWPKCHGWWIPPLRRMDLIIEVSHRYLAAGLTTTVLLLLAATFLKRREEGVGGRGGVLRPAALAAVLVVSAALLGAVVVKMELHNKYIIVLHLAIAMSLLATVAVATVRAGGLGSLAATAGGASSRTFRSASAAAAMAFVAVAFGGLTANVIGANGACQGFPTCSRGILTHGTPLWVHATHRVIAFALLFHTLGLAIAVVRRGESLLIRRAARIVFGTVVLQIVVAAALVELHLPAPLRSLHEAVGTLVWLTAFVFAALAHRASIGGDPAELEPVRPTAPDRPLGRPATTIPTGATAATAVGTSFGATTMAALESAPVAMAAPVDVSPIAAEPLAAGWMHAAATVFADAPDAVTTKSLFDERTAIDESAVLDAIDVEIVAPEHDEAIELARPVAAHEAGADVTTIAATLVVDDAPHAVARSFDEPAPTSASVAPQAVVQAAAETIDAEHEVEAEPVVALEQPLVIERAAAPDSTSAFADALAEALDDAFAEPMPMDEPAPVVATAQPPLDATPMSEAIAEPTRDLVPSMAIDVGPSHVAEAAPSIAAEPVPDETIASEDDTPIDGGVESIAVAAAPFELEMMSEPEPTVDAARDEAAPAEPWASAPFEAATGEGDADGETDDLPDEGVLVARAEAAAPRAYSALLEPPSLEEIDADEALADAPWLAEAFALDVAELEWETRAPTPVLRPIAPAAVGASSAAPAPVAPAVTVEPSPTVTDALARRRLRPPTLAVLIARGADF